MKHYLRFFFFCLSFLYSNLPALEICDKHWNEIQDIKSFSQSCFLESHLKGGRLFRSSFVFDYDEAAHILFKGRKSYSEFSAIFQDYLYICQAPGIDILYDGYSKIGDLFYNLYTECIAHHSAIDARYERSKIFFDRGLYEDCLSDIQYVVESGEWDKGLGDLSLIESKALFEAGAYDNVISKLSELIEKDPNNKDAWYASALVCFEKGDFDRAVKDYRTAEKSKILSKVKLKSSLEFKAGVLKGLTQGALEASKEFVPSLASSAYGLGSALWAGVSSVNQPVSAVAYFINSCEKMGKALADQYRNFDWTEVEDQIENEFKQFCENYDNLSDTDRGHLMGYTVGKYGVDFFAGGAVLKTITTFKRLKDANRFCNLETMAQSASNKKNIATSALKHSSDRENYFRNVKIEWDKQNKHIPGTSNFDPSRSRSIWEHKDPEGLLRRFAGTGRPETGTPGLPAYKETVDFGEHIGIWKNEENIVLKTTRGTIHYSKNGAHIVPAHPSPK